MMKEWRDIKGYESLYQVSNLGRVKSLGNSKSKKEKILSLSTRKDGRLQVCLYKNGASKMFKVHRLVAEVFIPNPNNLPQINHKDENPKNNTIGNLEWCTAEYNMNYGSRNTRISRANKGISRNKDISRNKGSKNARARKVQCITTGKKFNTIKEAGEYYGLSQSITGVGITNCCKGKLKSAGKHPVTEEKLIWKYL